MSDLFAWFQSYLNLSKLTAVTVPGMIVAFALVLVLGPVPCQDETKTCPYCSASLKPVKPAEPSTGGLVITPASIDPSSQGPQVITVTAPGYSVCDLSAKIVETGDQGLGHFDKMLRVDSSDPTKPMIAITFVPNTWNTVLNWFRPSSVPVATAELTLEGNLTKIASAKPTSGLAACCSPQFQHVQATFEIQAAKLDAKTKSTKKTGLAANTVITSVATWLASGQSSETAQVGVEIPRQDLIGELLKLLPYEQPKSQNAAKRPTTAQGQGNAGNNAGGRPKAGNKNPPVKQSSGPNQVHTTTSEGTQNEIAASDKNKPSNAQTTDIQTGGSLSSEAQGFAQGACARMPLYVLSNSRPAAQAEKSNGSDDPSKPKPGEPQYSEETVTSIEDLLSIADSCAADLNVLDKRLLTEIATQQTIIQQDTSDLTALSTSLSNAQTAGSSLVEEDLRQKVNEKKGDLEARQRRNKSYSQAESYVASLIGQAASIRSQVLSQASPLAPVTPSSSTSTATDVFQTIQQNLLKFLLFSLIVGQILDPIQRGLVSFAGPRRKVFEKLNNVYGEKGDGEIRYGDRRLRPWSIFWTKLEDEKKWPPPSPGDFARVAEVRSCADSMGLRLGPADFRYEENRNIYDPDYAVGAGFISQNEYNSIYNEYFTQSQLTSGLILPLLILSVCIGIRIISCAASSPVGLAAWYLLAPVLGTIYCAAVAGIFIAVGFSYLGSEHYGAVVLSSFGRWLSSLKSLGKPKPKEKRGKTSPCADLIGAQDPLESLQEPDDSSGWRYILIVPVALVLVATAVLLILEGSYLISCFMFVVAIATVFILHFLGWREISIVGSGVVLVVLSVLCIWANSTVLEPEMLVLLGLPSLFAYPLWIGGLDRLHKFYSQLQARIAGNILQLQTKAEQKLVDLVTKSDSLDAFRKKVAGMIDADEMLIELYRCILSKHKSHTTSSAPPATP